MSNSEIKLKKCSNGHIVPHDVKFCPVDGGECKSDDGGQPRPEPNTPIIEIKYYIKRLNDYTSELVLETAGNEVEIPRMQLVYGVGDVTQNKGLGIEVWRSPGNILIGSEAEHYPFEVQYLENDSYGALFFVDEQEGRNFRLVHPAKEKLRLR
jgi:hypothetical protein